MITTGYTNISADDMVGFVFTNYNNSLLTIQAIHSVFSGPSRDRCFITIVDNQSNSSEIDILKTANLPYENVHFIFNENNAGYFKGLNIGIKYLRERFFGISTIIIGNNDLVFPIDFVASLKQKKEIFQKFPVVSPNIVTLDGIHQNPHVINEISRFREIIWDLYYLNYFFALIIKKIAFLSRGVTERKDYHDHMVSRSIYQGYGACYILTKCFFDNFESLWAPTFLMGEEFYISKQIESKGFKIYYESSILVKHHDHATVDNMPSKKLWSVTKEFFRIYRKFISPYRKNMRNKADYNNY